jgi:hypothetical protein
MAKEYTRRDLVKDLEYAARRAGVKKYIELCGRQGVRTVHKTAAVEARVVPDPVRQYVMFHVHYEPQKISWREARMVRLEVESSRFTFEGGSVHHCRHGCTAFNFYAQAEPESVRGAFASFLNENAKRHQSLEARV